MKIIKISPQRQITIPSHMKGLCRTVFFAMNVEDGEIRLRPIEVKPVKTEKEYVEELLKKSGVDPKFWSEEGD